MIVLLGPAAAGQTAWMHALVIIKEAVPYKANKMAYASSVD